MSSITAVNNVDCAFTSPKYTTDQSHKRSCKSDLQDDNLFVVCKTCDVEPMYRCFHCYQRLQKSIDGMYKNKDRVIMSDATKAMMGIDWAGAIKEKELPDVVSIGDCEISTSTYIKSSDTHENIFEWVGGCPCCADKTLPAMPSLPVMERTSEPSIIKKIQIAVEHTAVDIDGNIGITTSNVELIFAEPTMDHSQSEKLLFRHLGEGDTSCYVFHGAGDDGDNLSWSHQWRVIKLQHQALTTIVSLLLSLPCLSWMTVTIS